jgi:hypothetical protein
MENSDKPKRGRGRPPGAKTKKVALINIGADGVGIDPAVAGRTVGNLVALGSQWDKINTYRGLQAMLALAIHDQLTKPLESGDAMRDWLIKTLETVHRIEIETIDHAGVYSRDIPNGAGNGADHTIIELPEFKPRQG